jgi:hypothetical protein
METELALRSTASPKKIDLNDIGNLHFTEATIRTTSEFH